MAVSERKRVALARAKLEHCCDGVDTRGQWWIEVAMVDGWLSWRTAPRGVWASLDINDLPEMMQRHIADQVVA